MIQQEHYTIVLDTNVYLFGGTMLYKKKHLDQIENMWLVDFWEWIATHKMRSDSLRSLKEALSVNLSYAIGLVVELGCHW